MGIPDYLTLHPDIAAKWGLPCVEYQTKQLGGNFGRFTIDQRAMLVQHQHSHEPNKGAAAPQRRRVELGDRHLPFHGDIFLFGTTDEGNHIRCAIRFTEGVMTWIKPQEDYPEELEDIAYA